VDIAEVNRLLGLGFTAQYIMALDQQPAAAPEARADPTPAADPAPAEDPAPAAEAAADPASQPAPAADPAPQTIPGLDLLTQKIDALTRALQSNNIKQDIIDHEPQTAEDILGAALVNAPPAK
jgi:hypothetical protein